MQLTRTAVIWTFWCARYYVPQVSVTSSATSLSHIPQWAGAVSQIITKQAPIRLEEESYRELCKQILRRDGWRCQFCGTMSNLEVHHTAFRSLSGEDTGQKLITLCKACPSSVHESGIFGGY
jgi:5-methylcytosine-specific restriction endonuclease McrA